MKINYFFQRCSLYVIALSLLLSSTVFAKEVNIYDQPKDGSKVVAKVDLAKGIIPIFTPKDGTWTKIADPSNGNVGWIKNSELNGNVASFSQRIINGDNKQGSVQVFEFGNSQRKLTAEQAATVSKQLEAQKEALQQSVQKFINSFDGIFTTQQPKPTTTPPASKE